MKKTIKIIFIILVSFSFGMLVQANLYAIPTRPKIFYKKAGPFNKALIFGQASWYSFASPGINLHTANNEIFNENDLTCAMWGVPFNQRLRITNRKNGKSIIVRVNDRGPHQRFVRQGRVIDLTKEAFHQIGDLHDGLIDVEIQFL